MVIRLNNELYDELTAYAREHLPEEACGLIAGAESDGIREITKIYYLENKDHSSEHFTLDPADQMKAIKDMRELGIKPLGNWHSHPESPSRPSQEDIKLAYDPKASYMILSLMTREAVLNSFHIENNEVSKEDLHIISEKYIY